VSCGVGQPKLYKVALNPSALNALASTCWRPGNAPVDSTQISHGFNESDWTIWDGTQDKQYLAFSATTFALGNANPVRVCTGSGDSLPCLIEGGGKAFTSSRVFTRNSVNPVETDTRSITLTFDDTPGATASGTINLKSNYSCGTANCTQPSCEVTLPFVARKVESQQTTIYQGP